MAYAAKTLAVVAKSIASVSNKLSIGAVLGLATLPVLPLGAVSGAREGPLQTEIAPIELVHTKPVPITDAASADPSFQLAARRSRVRRGPQPDAEEPEEASPGRVKEPDRSQNAASRKTSSISTPEADKTPLPSAPKPPEAAQTEPPKPDVWSDTQVIAALRECVRLLGPIAADVEVSEPLKHEQCGAPAPVLLKRIGSGTNKIEINPPATVNCAMVVGLHAWVEKTLQPAAQEAFSSPVTRLRSASGYNCRNRVGSRFHPEKLSEHALANAIDIAGFTMADGRTVEVARHWGPTARDEREAEKVASGGSKDGGSQSIRSETSKTEAARNHKISAIAHAAAETPGSKKTAELEKSGKGASDAGSGSKAIPATQASSRDDAAKSVEGRFLRRLHKGACGTFATVLGPEANEAHRDHFHLDLAPRRSSAYCQ